MKKFLEWIGLKEKLHRGSQGPPHVNERDIWWVSFGENIGSEINGKSNFFSRPALILKKLAHGFYLAAPTTSQKRIGTWYICINYGKKETFVCLHQVRTIDYRRLSSKLGQVDTNDFARIKEAFFALYK